MWMVFAPNANVSPRQTDNAHRLRTPSENEMEITLLLALLLGSIVGLSLGWTGGGGSIFAVPLLVYGLGIEFRAAVALSLAIVGLTAIYGAVLQSRKKQVLWRAGLLIGLGGVVAAPLGAWVGAQMPQRVSLLLFAALMVMIGVRLLRRTDGAENVTESWMRCRRQADGTPHFTAPCAGKLLGAGAASGVLSGIFGVGGGFLLVPALLLVARASIEQALATSLVGISLIAASAFAANAGNISTGDVPMAACFLAGSAIGMTFGAWSKNLIPSRALYKIFGLSVLGAAAFVIFRNIAE